MNFIGGGIMILAAVLKNSGFFLQQKTGSFSWCVRLIA